MQAGAKVKRILWVLYTVFVERVYLLNWRCAVVTFEHYAEGVRNRLVREVETITPKAFGNQPVRGVELGQLRRRRSAISWCMRLNWDNYGRRRSPISRCVG